MHRCDEWSKLLGAHVEVRKNGAALRTGVVEAVMPDQSALWLGMTGNNPRCMIFSSDGYEMWTDD
jgi:hypothetical protein